MSSPVSYDLRDGVATLTMDDGKVNAMSIGMLTELHRAFDRADGDEAVVLLTGREGIFSAGFDLRVIAEGGDAMLTMLRLGATLAERVLSFPQPVVTACNGHAYPMGAFLMLSADRRLGVDGPYRIGMNEVAIGLTVPLFAVELARQRLAPAWFQRIVSGDLCTPEQAVAAGFLDELVEVESLAARGREVAEGLAGVSRVAHRETKQRVRSHALQALRAAIESELTEREAEAPAVSARAPANAPHS